MHIALYCRTLQASVFIPPRAREGTKDPGYEIVSLFYLFGHAYSNLCTVKTVIFLQNEAIIRVSRQYLEWLCRSKVSYTEAKLETERRVKACMM